MRVVAGKFKGRKLKALEGKTTRPTTDKVKGAIFNMIGPYFSGGQALDLYGGSGGLGIEAVSRGMEKAVIADSSYGAIKIIQENVALTKLPEAFDIWKLKDQQTLSKAFEKGEKFALVFLDPPYAKQKIVEILTQLQEKNLLEEDAWVVCETDKEVVLPEDLPGFQWIKQQVYGISRITLYRFKEVAE